MGRKKLFYGILFVFSITGTVNRLDAQENNQSGYIITNSNDTIRGFIQNVNSGQFTKCSFKKDKKSPAIDYLPGEIAAYRFDGEGKFFISKEIPVEKGNKMVFLEYFIKGKANIYYMRDHTDHYYIQKEDDKLIELTEPPRFGTTEGGTAYKGPQKYTGKLKYLLSDCPDVYNEIDHLKLYPNQIIKLAKDYHNRVCTGEQCIIYEKKILPPKVEWGIVAGTSFNNFFFNGCYTDYQYNAFIGLNLEIKNIVFSSERLSLKTGLNLQQFDVYDFFDYDHNFISDLNLKSYSLLNPITINYSFPVHHFSPYLGLGISNMFILSRNNDSKVQDFIFNNGDLLPVYALGVVGAVGIKYKMAYDHYFNLEINCQNFQTPNPYGMNSNYYSVQIGYFF